MPCWYVSWWSVKLIGEIKMAREYLAGSFLPIPVNFAKKGTPAIVWFGVSTMEGSNV